MGIDSGNKNENQFPESGCTKRIHSIPTHALTKSITSPYMNL